jgi:hypothetical protein
MRLTEDGGLQCELRTTNEYAQGVAECHLGRDLSVRGNETSVAQWGLAARRKHKQGRS